MKKPLYTSLLALLIISLLLLPITCAQRDRHTVGFPEQKEGSFDLLENLLRSFKNKTALSELEVSGEASLNLSEVEQLLRDPTLPLSPFDRYQLRDFSNISVYEAISRIRNEDLRELLEKLYGLNRTLTTDEVLLVLNYLRSLRVQGTLTPSDELLALKALMDLAGSGDESLHTSLLYAMLEVIKSLKARRDLESLGPLPNLLPFQPEGYLSRGSSAHTRPRIIGKLPLPTSPGFPVFPHVSLDQLVPYLGVVMIATTLFTLLRHLKPPSLEVFGRLLNRVKVGLMKRQIRSDQALAGISDPYLKAYWSSVKLMELMTGVRRSLSTTHREFFVQVKSLLREDLARLFKEVTMRYELYRYAGVREAGPSIEGYYREMVRRAESKPSA